VDAAGAQAWGSVSGQVFLCLGTPAGAAWLDDLLRRNHEQLAADGVLLTSTVQPVPPAYRTVLVCDPLLADADLSLAQRTIGAAAPARVSVVYAIRELSLELTAQWQQITESGGTTSFEQYLSDLTDAGSGSETGPSFWRSHDPLGGLRLWAGLLPPERVHVLTPPPPGAGPRELWAALAQLLELDPAGYDIEPAAADCVPGAAELEFLRRVNSSLGDALNPQQRLRLVRDLLARQILAVRPQQHTVGIPPSRQGWVRAASQELVAGIEAGGYHVVGDLGTLLYAGPADPDSRDPARVSSAELLDVGADAITALAARMAEIRRAKGLGSPTESTGGDAGGGRRDGIQAHVPASLRALSRRTRALARGLRG
jgi:hypothetical protein